VVDVIVNTNEETEFEGLEGDEVTQAIFFEQLAGGMFVEVKGKLIDEEFIALKIEIKEDDDKNERSEFRGIVEEIGEDSYVISGQLVLTTLTTEYEYNDGEVSAGEFSLIVKVGDQVKVKGVIDEGVITAKSIELEVEHQQGAAEVSLWGAPTFENEVLTVHKHTISLSDQTDFNGEGGSLSVDEFLDEVNEWVGVKVKGDMLNEVLFAKEIKQKNSTEHNGDIAMEGKVEEVLDDSLLVAGHTMLID
jgi:hypothetical protein